MSKKKLIWVGCTLMGITFTFVICNLIANSIYEKQAIVYVEKVKSEYETKLKDANESIEKLKNEFAEKIKKEQESKQKPEEKNKEVVKKSEKKENTTTQKTESKNSTQKKETPKNNPPKESPDLLKRSNFDSMNMNFWATRLYYMDMALGEAQSSASDMLNNATLSQLEIKKTVSEYVQNLNQNYARFKEVESLGIPSICQNDYQQFKNLYSQYIKSYKNMYDENAKTYINVALHNKCESISSQLSQVRMKMESKLK